MAKDRPVILVVESFSPAALARLEAVGVVRTLDTTDHASLLGAVGDCDALVVRSYARITAAIIEAADRLQVIGRAGVGLDNIDVAAAKRRGITVVYTPAASTQAVAEHTVGLILALERHVREGHSMVLNGQFMQARNTFLSRQLAECTLGIVGMGRIGTAVGHICHDGLGMRILYNDIRGIGRLPFGARAVEKSQLFTDSDVVTLHVPLTDQTRNMIGRSELRQFKSTATLVNTARGGIVDSGALANALLVHALAGAAIDVYEVEPPPSAHPLLHAPNILLSPHVASRTAVGVANMNKVVDDVIAVLRGESPSWPA